MSDRQLSIIILYMGQSPQNCTVRQCVTSKFDIKFFSKFIKIGFTTFKKYGISFKKNIQGRLPDLYETSGR